MLDNIEGKLTEQWRLVRRAPIPYVAGMLLLGSLIFFACQWGYGRVIDQKDSEISVLNGRIKSVEAQRDDLQKQRDDLQKKLDAQPPSPPPPPHDPDVLYQFGEAAAQAPSGNIDRANGVVQFSRVVAGPTFNINADMEYRQFTLTGCQHGSYGSTGNFGQLTRQMFADVTCQISGLHH